MPMANHRSSGDTQVDASANVDGVGQSSRELVTVQHRQLAQMVLLLAVNESPLVFFDRQNAVEPKVNDANQCRPLDFDDKYSIMIE